MTRDDSDTMTDHVKPTPEQLKENIEKTTKELETMPVDEQKDTDSTPAPTLDALDTPDENKEEETVETKPDEPDDETPEEKKTVPAEEKKEEKKDEPTTEERYKESTREANKLYRNNAKMNEAIVQANSLPEPTEDELKKEFSDWEDMTNTEQRLAKETFVNKRFREHINQASQEQYKIDQWVDKVEAFTDDPQTLIDNPDLEGKMEEFKSFASDKKLNGSDFGLLVESFLFRQAKKKAQEPPKTGQMFETGGGATHATPKPKDDKIPLDEAQKLMKSNYSEYKRLLQAGKIAMI